VRTTRGRTLLLSVALACALPSAAFAAEQVEVLAEVVLASNQGEAIDPPELAKMKDVFSRSGFSFTSYKRLWTDKLTLKLKQAVEVKLPNQKTATLKLEAIENGSAKVQIEIKKLVSTTLRLGREGSLFQQAGDHQGGKLILVLSPVPKP
jgi:hypothetical protein